MNHFSSAEYLLVPMYVSSVVAEPDGFRNTCRLDCPELAFFV